MNKHTISLVLLVPLLVPSLALEVNAGTAKAPTCVEITCSDQKGQIRKHVKELLLQGEFDKITGLAQQYRKSKEKFSDGTWKLHQLYEAFGGCKDMDEWTGLLAKLDEWNKHETKDPAPLIAIGNAYWSFGKQARGNGFADTVTAEGWKLLGERLAIGRSKLVADSRKCVTCPEYFVVMMKLGIDGCQERESFMKLFEQGVKLEPTYLYLYEMKSYYILPRWYGKQGELREFVVETAKNNPEAALWVLWRLQNQGVYQNVCKDEEIDWNAIKGDLRKCLESSPAGVGHANILAYLSDIAGDAETLAGSLKSVDYQIDVFYWRPRARAEEIIKNGLAGENP